MTDRTTNVHPEPRIRAPGFDPAPLVRRALEEDLGIVGDVTTAAVVDAEARGDAVLAAREELVVAGISLARTTFETLDPAVRFTPEVADGTACAPGAALARVSGRLGAILSAERVALNFLQHLSGIATQAARYAAELEGSGVLLLDTRKTTPGLRAAEKYAVACGGGHNHRVGLFDGVLIKDNHLAASPSVAAAVERAQRVRHPLLRVEVEVESLEQALEAVDAGADALLVDNRAPEELARIVRAVRERGRPVFIEASGGVTLEDLAAVARTGVDAISSGAVIHAARWVDIGLDMTS